MTDEVGTGQEGVDASSRELCREGCLWIGRSCRPRAKASWVCIRRLILCASVFSSRQYYMFSRKHLCVRLYHLYENSKQSPTEKEGQKKNKECLISGGCRN